MLIGSVRPPGHDGLAVVWTMESHERHVGMPTRDIAVEFWTSPAVVPAPPPTKLLFQYLLNGPQTNYIGIYRFSWDTCRRDTGLTDAEIDAGLQFGSVPQEHDGDPFLMFDRDAGLVWVVKRLAHTFPGSRVPNQKQLKGIARMLEVLPRCALLKQACERYRALGEPFASTADRISIPVSIGVLRGVSIPVPIGGCEKPDDPPDPEGPDPVSGLSVSGLSVSEKNRAAAGASAAAPAIPPKRTAKALKDVLTREQVTRVQLLARDLDQLATDSRARWDTWACLQRMVNHHLPADIGISILRRLRDAWRQEAIAHPWAWVQRVLDREQAALRIRLVEAEHERVKREPAATEQIGAIMERARQQHSREPPGEDVPFV